MEKMLVSRIFSFFVFFRKPFPLGYLNLKTVSEKVNSLPNDKILDWSKLKAFADDEINVINKLKFVSERIESILGKRENAGYEHFLLFGKCLSEASFLRVVKSRDCVVKS